MLLHRFVKRISVQLSLLDSRSERTLREQGHSSGYPNSVPNHGHALLALARFHLPM